MTSYLSYTLSPADKHQLHDTSRLPTEFVKHLRVLFENLDNKHEGYIKISDLEKYWGDEYHLDESVSNSVIIKRLYELAPNNTDYLSFPRFCSGIKDALLEVKVRKQRPVSFINALELSNIDLNSTDEIDDTLSPSQNKTQGGYLLQYVKEEELKELKGEEDMNLVHNFIWSIIFLYSITDISVLKTLSLFLAFFF